MSMCDDIYRDGARMAEEPESPHVYDTVDWFNRANWDRRVVMNQLDNMNLPGYKERHEHE